MIEYLRPLFEKAIKSRLTKDELEFYEMITKTSEAAWEQLSKDEQRQILVKKEVVRDMIGDFILGFFRAAPKDQTLEELPKIYGHPSKIASLFMHHFEYTHDAPEKDYWQTPPETWARRSLEVCTGVRAGSIKVSINGDCDDYSAFAVWVLGQAGFRTQFLTMFTGDSGHATCLIDMGDEYWTVGTFYRVQHRTKDLQKVAEFFYEDVIRYKVYNQDPHTFDLTEIDSVAVDR